MRDPVILGHLIIMVYNSSTNQGDRKNGNKNFLFINNCFSNYFIMANPYRCVRTNKTAFASNEWPVLKCGLLLVKFNPAAGIRSLYRESFIQSVLTHVDKMRVQGLAEIVSDIKELLVSVFGVFRTMVKVVQKCSNMKTATALMDWLLDAILLLSDILTRRKVYGMNIIITLLRVFKLYKDSPLQAQSWQGLLVSLASFGVPVAVIDVVKRMSLLSNTKVLDDFSLFHQLISVCMDTLASFIETLGFAQSPIVKQVKEYGKDLIQHHSLLADIRDLCKMVKKDRRVFSESQFRGKIFSTHEKVSGNTILLDWGKTSPSVANEISTIKELNKLALAYENNSRQEPLCLCFEGPPGTFKSTIMSLLLKALNKSVYSHQVKSLMDGKDFYDQYDNQDIMLMDDLGAGGDSQFRFLVNLVSPIKYPLDCASEKLKDTKFFTSEAILFTTNKFSTIRSTTSGSGIVDLNAVKRRVLLIDFSHIKRKGDWIEGILKASEFSLEHKEYVPLFSIDIAPECDVSNKVKLLGWLSAIYELSIELKKSHVNNNTASNDLLEEIRKSATEWKSKTQSAYDPYTGEGIFQSYMQHAYAVCSSFVEERAAYFASYVPPTRTVMSNFVSKCEEVSNDMIIWGSIIGVSSILLSYGLFTYFFSQEQDTMQLQKEQDIRCQVVQGSTMAEAVAKQTFFIEFVKPDGSKERATGTVSGHFILAPWHAAKDCIRLSILSKVADCRLLDNAPCTKVYEAYSNDLVILKIPETLIVPFKSLVKVLDYKCDALRGHTLVTPYGCLPVVKRTAGCSILNIYGKNFQLDDSNSFPYTYSMDGLCGSLLFDNATGVIGAHIAGNEQYGRALKWNAGVFSEVMSLLKGDRFLLDLDFKDNGKLLSGTQLDANFHQSTPKTTKIEPTVFSHMFPKHKEPVDLSKYGPHTVKDVAKKSFAQVKEISQVELTFGLDYLSTLMEPFSSLSEQDTVKGFDKVAKINMDKSTGIGCDKDRSAYINFERGYYTQLLRKEIKDIENNLLEEEHVNLNLWIAKETLKDEVRSVTKNKEPRSFRVLRFPINVLCKQLTGEMVNNIIANKFSNGIMIGINPYSEWETLYNTVGHKAKGLIAADIKKFDGGMLPQVQHGVVETILSFFQGTYKEKELLKGILHNFINNPVAVNDDVYLTTHSMPSGCYLTAIMNSMVQKVYTAMWYKHQVPSATVTQYKSDVYDAVYGDDKLCSVRNKEDILNAITMRDYFQLIGLDLSTADKKEITQPFDSWEDINFLKRKFVFHPVLKRIMCPLIDETFYSMLAWWDTSKDFSDVIDGKLRSFTYESYLREDNDINREKLKNYLDNVAGMTWIMPSNIEMYRQFHKNEVEYTTYA